MTNKSLRNTNPGEHCTRATQEHQRERERGREREVERVRVKERERERELEREDMSASPHHNFEQENSTENGFLIDLGIYQWKRDIKETSPSPLKNLPLALNP